MILACMIVGFVFFLMFNTERHRDDFVEKCNDAGGVAIPLKHPRQICVDPSAVIHIDESD